MKIKEKDLNFTDWKGGAATLEYGDSLLIGPGIESFNLICCDCGLAHNIEVNFTDKGNAQLKFFRDNRSTAARRRGNRPGLKEGVGKWKLTRTI